MKKKFKLPILKIRNLDQERTFLKSYLILSIESWQTSKSLSVDESSSFETRPLEAPLASGTAGESISQDSTERLDDSLI